MATCDVQTLLDEAKCFGCGLTSRQLEVLQLQLLCEISQTGPSGLFLSQAANLSDVDDPAASATNLGLGTGDSPVFTGATLTGMTPGSVLFAGTGGAVSQDNANFFFDNTLNSLKLGPRGTGTFGVPTLNNFESIRAISGAAGGSNITHYRETQLSGTNTGATVMNDLSFAAMSGGAVTNYYTTVGYNYISAGTITNDASAGQFIAFNLGATLNKQYGITGNAYTYGGTTALAAGLQFAAGVFTPGVVTTIYGADVGVAGDGAITTGYGLRVTTNFTGTVATALYGIYNLIGRASAIGEVIRGAAAQTGDLLQFQNSAGTVLTKVLASGAIDTIAGTQALPAITGGDADSGYYWRDGGIASAFSVNNNTYYQVSAAGVSLKSTAAYGWAVDEPDTSSNDVALTRAAAGKLSLSTGSAMYFPDGTAAAPSVAFASDPDTGIYSAGANILGLAAGGVGSLACVVENVRIRNDGAYQWSSTTSISASPDLMLLRDAANTLAQRNGVNAQAFRVYNTFTDASNFERAEMYWSGSIFGIRTLAGGSGTGRSILINSSGTNISLQNAGNAIFNVTATGLMAGTDNTYDIGASGATRPRTGYFGTSIISPLLIGGSGTTSDLILQTTSGVGAAGADMHFLVGNNGGTEAITILNNGNVGIATVAPSQKLEVTGGAFISGTTYFGGPINARGGIANDSGANLTLSGGTGGITAFVGHVQLGNAAVAQVVVPTHTVTLKDSTGTTYRVPCIV